MQASNIEWTDYTWNPTSGCTKVSAGCKNCYAEANVLRFKGNSVAYPNGFDLTLKPHKLREPLTKRIPPSRIFVNSMSDLFHPDVPDSYIDQVFDVMEQCPQHTFQVLTKRPLRMAEYTQKRYDQAGEDYPEPLPNRHIWLGTSVEDNRTLKRIATLLTVQTETIFVSFEPLLERIDLDRLADELLWAADGTLDWAIIGGESGKGARPCRPRWVAELLTFLRYHKTAVFVKQLGEVWAKESGAKDRKGGRPDEWPADLRVREFPGVAG